MWHKAFVALINYWAHFVAFEEAIYHLERWPPAPGWWRAPMPTGGWNPCGGGRGREPGGFCWDCQHALFSKLRSRLCCIETYTMGMPLLHDTVIAQLHKYCPSMAYMLASIVAFEASNEP
jgi:hypothetical protein